MELNLKKPIIFFDLETTGINITHDRIVEISVIKIMPNGEVTERTRRVNPGMPIPPRSYSRAPHNRRGCGKRAHIQDDRKISGPDVSRLRHSRL